MHDMHACAVENVLKRLDGRHARLGAVISHMRAPGDQSRMLEEVVRLSDRTSDRFKFVTGLEALLLTSRGRYPPRQKNAEFFVLTFNIQS